MLLWIFRTLASLLLSFIVFAAFLLWSVVSAVSSDLESGERSRLSVLLEATEDAGYAYAADLRRSVDQYRYGPNQGLDRARSLLLAATAFGAIIIGLLHLPDRVSSLRWPGYALLATGGTILLLGWLSQAILPEIIGKRVDSEIRYTVTSTLSGLLQGIGLPGLWLAGTGALLIAGSHALKHWRGRQRAPAGSEPG